MATQHQRTLLAALRKLVVDGLTASVVSTSRRAWDEKVLRQLLTEDQLLQAQKVTESTSLRVVDDGQVPEA